jgi:hypothetical protein
MILDLRLPLSGFIACAEDCGKEGRYTMKIAFTLGALLATAARAFEDHAVIYISEPHIQLVAGTSNISAI